MKRRPAGPLIVIAPRRQKKKLLKCQDRLIVISLIRFAAIPNPPHRRVKLARLSIWTMAATVTTRASQDDGKHAASAKRKTLEEIEVDLALPEPPSKRARRALKKGKSLPSKSDGDDEKITGDTGGGDDAGEDQKTDKKARSEHGIWVGNLPFTVSAAELKQWLVDNSGGVITNESITRLKLPMSRDPNTRDKSQKPANRGFAYVDFVDMSTKVAAIALSETELQHRKLLIKDSTSFEGRPAKAKEPEPVEAGTAGGPNGQKQNNKQEVDPNASRKIFVGNMSFQTTEEDVRRNFEKCGEIEWVKVATFEDTGKCKGYGWVKFKEPAAAAWAVKGFVKVKEAVETEEDFKDDEGEGNGDKEEDGTDGDGGGSGNGNRGKQFKTRKWWVNRMMGRELKLELAEDDHVRYKKRFGKDAVKKQQQQHQTGAEKTDAVSEAKSTAGAAAADLQTARLKGTVVKHTGTKIMLD